RRYPGRRSEPWPAAACTSAASMVRRPHPATNRAGLGPLHYRCTGRGEPFAIMGWSGVAAYGHGADGQPGAGLEDLADTLALAVEFAALPGGEGPQRLDGDVHPTARAPLVPQPGHHAVDQQDLEVPWQHAVGRRSGVEQP